MSSRRYKTTHRAISMADATTIAAKIVSESVGNLFRLEDDASPFRWSDDQAVVDAGGGFPVLAGEAFSIPDPSATHTVYFRQVSGAPTTLHWAYSYPVTR